MPRQPAATARPALPATYTIPGRQLRYAMAQLTAYGIQPAAVTPDGAGGYTVTVAAQDAATASVVLTPILTITRSQTPTANAVVRQALTWSILIGVGGAGIVLLAYVPWLGALYAIGGVGGFFALRKHEAQYQRMDTTGSGWMWRGERTIWIVLLFVLSFGVGAFALWLLANR